MCLKTKHCVPIFITCLSVSILMLFVLLIILTLLHLSYRDQYINSLSNNCVVNYYNLGYGDSSCLLLNTNQSESNYTVCNNYCINKECDYDGICNKLNKNDLIFTILCIITFMIGILWITFIYLCSIFCCKCYNKCNNKLNIIEFEY